MFDLNDLLNAVLPAVFIGGPYAAALMLGLLLPLALVGTGVVSQRLSPSARLSWIFVLMIVGSAAVVALSGRVLVSEAEASTNPFLRLADDPSPWGARASQLFTALILLVSGAEIVNWAFGKNRLQGHSGRLWGTMMLYFVCAVIISGIAGEFRNPRLNDLYVPLVLTAVALLAGGADEAMWRRIRWALVVPSAGSLVAMAVLPKVALLPDFTTSLIPGVHVRLYGLSDHANSLGIFAAAALVLELSPVLRARPAWWLLLLHFVVLLLTQSKTAWIGAFIGVMLVRWYWIRDSVFKGNARNMTMVGLIVACFGLALAGIAVVLFADSPRVVRLLDRIGAFTFTGRTQIWQVTMQEFYDSPITGYGPSLWDLPYRIQHGMLQAGQAHNQFVQTLGQAGLLGILSLLAYLGAMWIYAWSDTRRSNAWGLVLVLMLLVRCLSESPMRMGSLIGADWIHFVAFAAVASSAVREAGRRSLNDGAGPRAWRGVRA